MTEGTASKRGLRTRARSSTNRRSQPRTRSSAAIFWRRLGEDDYQVGWLLETSDGGFAFACRGSAPPTPGERLQTKQVHAATPDAMSQVLVRRTRFAHEDLTVIACSRASNRPFQTHALQGLVAEIAPHRPSGH